MNSSGVSRCNAPVTMRCAQKENPERFLYGYGTKDIELLDFPPLYCTFSHYMRVVATPNSNIMSVTCPDRWEVTS